MAVNELIVTPEFLSQEIPLQTEFASNIMSQDVAGGGGGKVQSVNGMIGDVVLDAGDLAFDGSEAYTVGTIGAALEGLHSVVTITLTSDNWTDRQQTATVTGVLADETKQLLHIIPAAASRSAFVAAGVMGVSQAANAVTFECVHVPTANLSVYVAITELEAGT